MTNLIIDTIALNTLLETLGEKELTNLRTQARDEIDQRLETLKISQRAQLLEDIQLQLHTIKGIAFQFGFSLIAQKATHFEEQLKTRQGQPATQLEVPLTKAIDKTWHELDRLYKT